MTISYRSDDGVSVIGIAGEVDHFTCERLRRVIHAVLASGVTTIALDCRDLTFADAGAVSVVVELQHHMARRRGQVAVYDPHGRLRRLLDISGVGATIQFT
jgi:anti-anti-sigma factor